MSFWKPGPREWFPRQKRGLRMVRQLHDCFPKYMLEAYKYKAGWEPGQIHIKRTLRGDEQFKLAFAVAFEKPGPYARLDCDGVWISAEGVLDVGSWIRRMLKEGLPLYPHLAGRWPWKEAGEEIP